MKIGIVGLPNVGKSTLFNALTCSQAAAVANYPFCTIEPNVGIVAVPDKRLPQLAALFHSQKIVPTTIEFVDIAGLVAGAAQGEGLGNQFLAHIRAVDAICQVVRDFRDRNIQHVVAEPDPARDFATIETELLLADIATTKKRLEGYKKAAKSGEGKLLRARDFVARVLQVLNAGRSAREIELAEDDVATFQELQLLTAKPEILVINLAEQDLAQFSEADFRAKLQLATSRQVPLVPIAGKVEATLADLTEREAKEFLAELNLKESGLQRLTRASYKALDLLTFLTAGEKETRAWTVKRGSKAPVAAGRIHSDFERGFIRVEVIAAEKLLAAGGLEAARAAGLIRSEGKEYVVQDGDVCEFRFNV